MCFCASTSTFLPFDLDIILSEKKAINQKTKKVRKKDEEIKQGNQSRN